MANFKRKGPKSTRAGCLMCKPHKHQGSSDSFGSLTLQEQRAVLSDQDSLDEGVETRHRGRAKIKKPYTLERCETGHAWAVYRRYATKAGRDMALTALGHNRPPFGAPYPYRAGPDRF